MQAVGGMPHHGKESESEIAREAEGAEDTQKKTRTPCSEIETEKREKKREEAMRGLVMKACKRE